MSRKFTNCTEHKHFIHHALGFPGVTYFTCAMGHNIQLALSTSKSRSLMFATESAVDLPSSLGRLTEMWSKYNILARDGDM